MSKPIIITFINKEDQRYDTAGDYQEFEDHIDIKISNQENDDYSFAIAIHELIERHFNTKNGITEKQVDDFDMPYEGPYFDMGNGPKAPYHLNHLRAQIIERLLIDWLGHDWTVYDEQI